jgi:glycerol-3-phosphate acyltransferase PlsX
MSTGKPFSGLTYTGPLTDIVLDAMGSDKAPEPEVRGAILACRTLPVRVHLVGPEKIVRPVLETHLRGQKLPIEIIHASEWISMEDKAVAAVRAKRDSSMRVGLKLVREQKAAGFITAGNTGAAMATAKMVLGGLPGVDRPALAALLPTSTGSPCILLDVGANVDCKPHNLEQFAVMGEAYSRLVLRVKNPRVGLFSIGEEETKGNELTRETFPLLRELQAERSLNFIGNVEGRDLYNGNVDVVVCDGFVGNVALKTSEGLAKLVRDLLKSTLSATVTATVGAMLSRQAFNAFKRRLDYSEYGGAPLLGVRGVCIVGHGSSNERAIMNAVRVAAEYAQGNVNAHIEQELASRPARQNGTLTAEAATAEAAVDGAAHEGSGPDGIGQSDAATGSV